LPEVTGVVVLLTVVPPLFAPPEILPVLEFPDTPLSILPPPRDIEVVAPPMAVVVPPAARLELPPDVCPPAGCEAVTELLPAEVGGSCSLLEGPELQAIAKRTIWPAITGECRFVTQFDGQDMLGSFRG
jgi:hypothetical protein